MAIPQLPILRTKLNEFFNDYNKDTKERPERPEKPEAQRVRDIFSLLTASVRTDYETSILTHLKAGQYSDTIAELTKFLARYWAYSRLTRQWTLDAFGKLLCEDPELLFEVFKTMIMDAWTYQEVRMLGTVVLQMEQSSITRSTVWERLESLATTDVRSAMANQIALLALLHHEPILACAIAVRACTENQNDENLISEKTLNSIAGTLCMRHPAIEQFNVRAIRALYEAYPHRLSLTYQQKTGLMNLALDSSAPIEFCNETFWLAKKIGGSKVPFKAIYTLVDRAFSSGAIDMAAALWHELIDNYALDALVDSQQISKAIFHFSKRERYRQLATRIVDMLPEESYSMKGITAAMLLYCARLDKPALLQKVYQRIPRPVDRDTLRYLLQVHCMFGDANGVEKILGQITRQGSYLKPVEVAILVKYLCPVDLDRAVSLAERFPPDVALRAYAEIVNHAIDTSNFELADKYLQLVYKNMRGSRHSFAGLAANLLTKRLLSAVHDMANVRRVWQHWLAHGNLPKTGTRALMLQAILDEIIRRNDTRLLPWLALEWCQLGRSPRSLQTQLRKSTVFRSRTAEQQEELLSILDPKAKKDQE